MKQLTQQLRDGKVSILEAPAPIAAPGFLVIRNHYSLISAGTEAATARTARKSLLGKAKERPEQVRQVLAAFRKQGPRATYNAVMKKLDAYSPMGYSCAGEVVDVGAGVADLAVGDRVACAGVGYASHAELVAVPRNLCVKLDPAANLRSAAFNTVGAIAMQGVRQADLRVGETCAVIGLGLLGQLTCQLLRASGVRPFGIDVNPWVVDFADRERICESWLRSDPALAGAIENRTDGLGADAVIITAAAPTTDPINLAGELCRKRGRVVIVGDVPAGFNREPHYYRKELEVRMSCSYGPGRYDPDYEEGGVDYPAAYVRWTQNRNMQAFQRLLEAGSVDVQPLITHEFPLAEAADAYDMIVAKSEPYLGIVVRYDEPTEAKRRVQVAPVPPSPGALRVALIGAGSYAQGSLLPPLVKQTDVVLDTVVTATGPSGRRVAERFGFAHCSTDGAEVLARDEADVVFIATRHDSHGRYVQQALTAGAHVFVEKPLCLHADELDSIAAVLADRPDRRLMVGFNRRFAPLAAELKGQLAAEPLAMLYRVNAGHIPPDHWTQRAEGGGRILGEACHFIDLMTYFAGALPTLVHAAALPDPQGLNDVVSINLQFANGSIGAIQYLSNGSPEVPKEYVEVSQLGRTWMLDDFRKLTAYGRGKPQTRKLMVQDKGQSIMIERFLQSVRNGDPPPIPPDELFAVTAATFAVLSSLATRQSYGVD